MFNFFLLQIQFLSCFCLHLSLVIQLNYFENTVEVVYIYIYIKETQTIHIKTADPSYN